MARNVAFFGLRIPNIPKIWLSSVGGKFGIFYLWRRALFTSVFYAFNYTVYTIIQLWRLRFNWVFQVEFYFTRNSNVAITRNWGVRFSITAMFIDITRNSRASIEIGMNIFIFTLPNGESTLQCTTWYDLSRLFINIKLTPD